jgi:type IV secretion system protein VirD4
LLPQELKELGQDKEIIILENTKPILCEKARYFSDDSFIDRLKAISPTLAALGKQLPSKDQLEHAAFVRNELASAVPTLDIDLHKAKMERRIRTAGTDEPIDLAKLAVDVDALPAIDNPENPSEEQVAGLVDAFFSQLDWVDENTGEFGEPPAAGGVVEFGGEAPIDEPSEAPASATGGGEIEPVFAADEPLDEPSDDYFDEPGEAIDAGRAPTPAAPFLRTKPHSGAIDLAVLDQ